MLTGQSERERERELPEAGKVGPVEFRLSGGGGAGRLGRTRVCGTTAAAGKGKSSGNKRRESGKRRRK